MPIGNITQIISELPAAGRRGVDVQSIFVAKQEDFQDHLQGTTITELNTLKGQLNSRIGEINSTATTMNGYADTASAGASTATTKAGEASTSAGETLAYRNQAETYKNNASSSATKASQWSDNNYNVEVEAGKYSAKHWSTVAQNTAASVSNFGFKNYIINGGFDVWQRGTAVVLALETVTFIADRFFGILAGAQKNMNRVVLDENYNNKYGLSINGSNSSSNAYIVTRLEAINTHKLHGKTATLSCKVFATNAGNMAINIDRPTGVDNFTSTTTLHTENIVLTAGVNNISFSVTFNEVDPTYGLQVAFLYGALAPNDTRVLADVQLEEGSVATPFEQRPYGLELSLCQRYYETGVARLDMYSSASCIFGYILNFKQTKRLAPSLGILNPSYINADSASVAPITENGFFAYATSISQAQCRLEFAFTASAEL